MKPAAPRSRAFVGQMPGVKRVAVSFGAREAQVEFDAGVTNDAGIVSAIERAWFRAQAPAR